MDVTAGQFPGVGAGDVPREPVSVRPRAQRIIWPIPDGHGHLDAAGSEVPRPGERQDVVHAPVDPAGAGGFGAEQVTG